MNKQKEIILEWYKTSFDEEDAQKICNSSEQIKDYTEIAMIWAMFKAAELLGRTKEFKAIMGGEKEEDIRGNHITDAAIIDGCEDLL